MLVVDLAFTALPCSSVASPGCSPSLLGTELTILRGRGAAYSKEVLATWTRANGIGSIGSIMKSKLPRALYYLFFPTHHTQTAAKWSSVPAPTPLDPLLL